MPGLLRRGIAIYVDLLMAVAAGMWVALVPGVFIPLDRMGGWQVVLTLPVCLAILGYVFLGPAILPNTYGRYLLGVRVVDDATGARPGLRQAFTRTFTVGLWPIEALLIAFSRSRRRIGDRWANTRAVRYTPSARVGKRLLPASVAVVLLASLFLLIPLVARRMDVSRAAAEYAARKLDGGVTSIGFVRVVDDRGTVALRMDDGRTARVHLVRDGGRWDAKRAEPIPRHEVGRGFSVQRGHVEAASE